MTEPDEALTVGELVELLITEFDDDQPVAVQCSGAYDFLHPDAVSSKDMKSTVASPHDQTCFLDGEHQGGMF